MTRAVHKSLPASLSGAAFLALVLAAGPTIPPPPPVFPTLLPAAPCCSASRVAACFAPGTRQSYIDRTYARARATDEGGKAFQAWDFARWSTTATDGVGLGPGDPTTLTWSIVADGTFIPSGLGEPGSASDLRAYLNGIYGSESNWMPHFERVFERWGELTGVTYVHVTYDDGRSLSGAPGQAGVRADIRIGGHDVDGPFGVLAFNSFPNDGDMVIDTGDTFFQSRGSGSRALRNVIAHEHGHGLALDHVCPRSGTKLMEPNVSLSFDGPQHDDIRGAQRLYGDPREPNDGAGSATDLGTRGGTQLTLTNVSIDDNSDSDFYRVTVAEGASADVTLRPVGKAYDNGPEGGGSACGPTERIDTRTDVDLRLALLTSSGTLIASADATRAGGIEELLDVPLPASSPEILIRVRGAGENTVQLYQLEMRFVQRGAKPVAVQDVATTFEVLPVEVPVLDNDEGLDDEPIDVRVVTRPASGKAKVVGDRTVYIPDADFTGTDVYTYEISDAHGQAATATVTIDVVPSARAGFARHDADADGYPDDLETALGASSTDAGSRPGEDIAATRPADLTLGRLRLRIDGRRSSRDWLRLRGHLDVDEGFEPDGARVAVYVAGIVREFTLDERGRSRLEPRDDFKLRLRRSKGVVRAGAARFDLRIGEADLAAHVADEGLDTSRRQRREPRAATVFVLFDGRTYAVTVPLRYSAKKGRKGTAKLVR